MSNTVTITGASGRDPELRFTQAGKAVLNGSIADTPRKYDRDRNEWVDAGDTLWLEWSIWEDEAEYLAEHVQKGSKLTITGKLRARSYETREGDKRTVIELAAESVAIHPRRGQGQQQRPQQSQQQSRGGDDPWARSSDSTPPF